MRARTRRSATKLIHRETGGPGSMVSGLDIIRQPNGVDNTSLRKPFSGSARWSVKLGRGLPLKWARGYFRSVIERLKYFNCALSPPRDRRAWPPSLYSPKSNTQTGTTSKQRRRLTLRAGDLAARNDTGCEKVRHVCQS